MIDAFLYFIVGAVTMRILQLFLAVTPNYNIFKNAEYISLYVLGELHVQRLTALKILELSYEESDRSGEFEIVKNAMNERYDALINKCIANLKAQLPYKVQYNTLNEALTAVLQEKSEEEKRYGKR